MSTNPNFDPQTGAVTFRDPAVTLGPTLTRDAFLASNLGRDAKDLIITPPWQTWRAAPECRADRAFRLVVCFHAQALHHLELSDTQPPVGDGWDNWSEADEQQRKAHHDRWLDEHVGPQREYDWGRVDSFYDERAGYSFIRFAYG
ncbi:MAG: hypothetical protein AAGK09_02545 [Planctomycetota bacterium]